MDLFNFEEIQREFAALAMAYCYWYTCRRSYTDAHFLNNTFTNELSCFSTFNTVNLRINAKLNTDYSALNIILPDAPRS